MFRKLFSWAGKKRDSIAFQLLLIASLLILCPVVIASTVSYSQYTKNLEQKSAEGNYQTIVQLSYSLNSYLDQLLQLSGTVYYNNDMMNALETHPAASYGKLQKERTVEEQLSETFVNARSDVLSAYLIADGQIYRAGVDGADVDSTADYKAYGWYREALKNTGAVYVPAHTEQLVLNPRHTVFSVVRRVNSIRRTNVALGVLKIDVNYSTIRSICDKISMGAGGGLLIEDGNGAVIYSSVTGQNSGELDRLVRQNRNGSFTASLQGKQYLVGSVSVPEAGWTVVSLSSVEELNRSATRTRDMTFCIALVCAAAAIVLLALFVRSFLRPLLRIVGLMKEVQNGRLDVSFPEKRKDEIGYLGSSFNRMIRQIRDMMTENTNLVREVYEAKLLQKEAQINALSSQIRPHFLFNTLNMISLLVRCGHSEEALRSIDELSDLLRCMTHCDREITVKEELHLLDAYLGIQSTRYRDRLAYTIDVDKRLLDYVIPALTFQPIVENAVVHGCEKQKDKITISVTSRICPDSVEFRLEDNAGGIDAATLASLREKMARREPGGEKNGVGLLNVDQRLKMKFGDDYGLVIESTEGTGTCVRVLLPRPAEWEGSTDVPAADC